MKFFEDERDWLGRQPGMHRWTEGCLVLERTMQGWIVETTAAWRTSPPDSTAKDDSPYRRRLWNCWRYHWKQAVNTSRDNLADGTRVAERLRAGIGQREGSKLGGNPLADVVLATAIGEGDQQAMQYFLREFEPFAMQVAARISEQHGGDLDWWADFFRSLVFRPGNTCKLENFQGECALKPWLKRSIVREVIRRQDKGRKRREKEEVGGQDRLEREEIDAAAQAAENDCFAKLGPVLGEAFSRLNKEDRLLLWLIFVEHLPNNEVAEMLFVHPGTIGRRRDRAIAQLHEALFPRPVDDDGEGKGNPFRDCFQLLLGSLRAADLIADLVRTMPPPKGKKV